MKKTVSKAITRPPASPASSLGQNSIELSDRRASSIAQRKLHAGISSVTERNEGLTHHDTGLPHGLKAGIEGLSGVSLDDVRVHYNSSRPAGLQALAYTQGTQIHLGPGQERHLPHEAWHVVQQKQGRVRPTTQLQGSQINDDARLESEADVMGSKGLQVRPAPTGPFAPDSLTEQGATLSGLAAQRQPVAQLRRSIGLFGLEAEVLNERFFISAATDNESGALLMDPNIRLEEYALGTLGNEIDVTLDNEIILPPDPVRTERSYTVEFIQKPVDVIEGQPSDAEKMAKAWTSALSFWDSNLKGPSLISSAVPQVDWYTPKKEWRGDQFDEHVTNRHVSLNDDVESSLIWTGADFLSSIRAKTPDPEVSIQLTAGSNLIGLERAYLATVQILLGGKPPSTEDLQKLGKPEPTTEEEHARQEVDALINLIIRYTQGTRPGPSSNKRYAKEYLALMSRNSLDAVFDSMSDLGRRYFRLRVAKYFTDKSDKSYLFSKFHLQPSEPVFARKASKEAVATTITMEELLLSITKQKRSDTEQGLVDDPHAKLGDIFAQNELAGISEISARDPESVERFHIKVPGEMMAGLPGVIFENRLAKVRNLSEMPGIFWDLAKTLHTLNGL